MNSKTVDCVDRIAILMYVQVLFVVRLKYLNNNIINITVFAHRLKVICKGISQNL